MAASTPTYLIPHQQGQNVQYGYIICNENTAYMTTLTCEVSAVAFRVLAKAMELTGVDLVTTGFLYGASGAIAACGMIPFIYCAVRYAMGGPAQRQPEKAPVSVV